MLKDIKTGKFLNVENKSQGSFWPNYGEFAHFLLHNLAEHFFKNVRELSSLTFLVWGQYYTKRFYALAFNPSFLLNPVPIKHSILCDAKLSHNLPTWKSFFKKESREEVFRGNKETKKLASRGVFFFFLLFITDHNHAFVQPRPQSVFWCCLTEKITIFCRRPKSRTHNALVQIWLFLNHFIPLFCIRRPKFFACF